MLLVFLNFAIYNNNNINSLPKVSMERGVPGYYWAALTSGGPALKTVICHTHLGRATLSPVRTNIVVRITFWLSQYSGQFQFLDQCPDFGLCCLANTHLLVYSVKPTAKFWSARSGQHPNFDWFGLSNNIISICVSWPMHKFWSVLLISKFTLFGMAPNSCLSFSR